MMDVQEVQQEVTALIWDAIDVQPETESAQGLILGLNDNTQLPKKASNEKETENTAHTQGEVKKASGIQASKAKASGEAAMEGRPSLRHVLRPLGQNKVTKKTRSRKAGGLSRFKARTPPPFYRDSTGRVQLYVQSFQLAYLPQCLWPGCLPSELWKSCTK